jgi:iron complex outermembrane receptor protein
MHTNPFKRSVVGTAVFLACNAAFAQSSVNNSAEKVLPAITVTPSADASSSGLPAPYAGGQVARGGRVGVLGNVDNMDSPFSSTIYTQTLIQDQQSRSVADVLLNDPTVRVARGFGNYQELYVVRGFPVNSDDLAYNGLYGLLPRQIVATELLERVEVLRGASAFLNGAAPGGGGIGGSINLLPKRAPNDPLTQFTAGVDSGGQRYLATDLARRFGPDKSTGIRVNLARRDGDTAIDDEKRELSLFSAGMDYRSRNIRLSADVGFQDHKLNRARPSVTIAAGLAIPTAPDASANFSQPWSYSNERDTFGTLRGEIDLATDVTAWAAAGARRGEESNALANPTVTNAAGDTSTYRFDNARKDSVRTGEIGIRSKLRTGSVGHSLSASASAFDQESRNAYAISNFAGFASNLYSPVTVASPPPNFLVGGALANPLLTQKTELSSIALADTMSFAGERVLVTLGARRQAIKERSYNYNTGALATEYDKSSVTPVAGLVVKATKNISLYANYIEALSRGPTAGATALNAGEVFAPYRSKQKEIGAKYDAGSIGMTLALFTTSQPMGMINPATNIFGIDGEQRNRGAELSIYGTPVRGVRLLGGLTVLDAKQKRTAGGLNDGKDVIGVPDLQTNLGAEWDVPGVRGLSVNGRAIYTGSQYADAANTQSLPSWTRYDVGVRYIASIGNRMITIRGQIENLADRSYWASAGGFPGAGYLVLGNPRTFVMSASLDF